MFFFLLFLINCPSVFVRVGVYFDYYGNIKHVHYLPVFVKKSLLTEMNFHRYLYPLQEDSPPRLSSKLFDIKYLN